MTTVVYKDGVVAYESFQTRGGVITNNNANKLHTVNGVKFILCGNVSDYEEFLEIAVGRLLPEKELEVEGLMVLDGRLYSCSINGDFWKMPIKKDEVYAIGSGKDFAYTAMDCGLSAKEAVKMAIKRDLYSGGRIRTIKL